MINRKFFCLLVVTGLFVAGCDRDQQENDPSGQESFDRASLLTNVADNIVLPRYADFQANVGALYIATQEFSSNASETTLLELQTAWRSASLSWQRCAMFEFGPAGDRFMQVSTNVFPVDTEQLEANVELGEYDFGAANNLATKGFPGLDYLLFGDELAITVESFSTAPNATNRITYLTDIVEHLKTNADGIVSDWNSGYRDQFVGNTGTDSGSSLSILLNAFNQSYEAVTRTQKLGFPSGAITFSGTPLPDHVEAYYEGQSNVSFIRESVIAFEDLYLGTSEDGSAGVGLDDYLNHLESTYNGQSLNTAIEAQIDAVLTAVDLLQDPLAEFVESDNPTCIETYAEMQQLVVFWKVDMMSSLGVLVTYQDNDGD